MDKTPATRVEETEVNGQSGWLYSDGSIRASDGRLLKKPSYASTITKDDSRAMLARRQAIGQQRAIEGLTEGMGLPLSKAGSGDEWAALVKHFSKTFAESKNLRGQAEAFEKLGRATGYLSSTQEENTALGAVTGAVLKLLERLDRDTITGKVIE